MNPRVAPKENSPLGNKIKNSFRGKANYYAFETMTAFLCMLILPILFSDSSKISHVFVKLFLGLKVLEYFWLLNLT